MTNTPGTNGLTYRDAGVDIDEGERLVDLIKPAAKSTARPGAEAALGGFAAAFDPVEPGIDAPAAQEERAGSLVRAARGHGTILEAECIRELAVIGAEGLRSATSGTLPAWPRRFP